MRSKVTKCLTLTIAAALVGSIAPVAHSADDAWSVTVPSRVLDTRSDAIRPAGSTTSLRFAGHDSIPADASTVLLNLTAVDATAPGYVTVYPCDTQRPTASNLNYTPGTARANLVAAKLDDDGRTCIYTHSAVHIIADIQGYTTAGIGLTEPTRFLDTRNQGLAPAGSVTELALGGHSSIPDNANTVLLNLTAVDAKAPGYFTVYPCDTQRPTTSNLNYTANSVNANLVVAKLDPKGRTCVYTHAAAHIVADIQGYLAANLAAPVSSPAPSEISVPAHQPTQGVDGFVHPGVFIDREQLDSVRDHVAAGDQPWTTAYNRVLNSGSSQRTDRRPTSYRYSSLSYTPAPVPVIQSASSGNQAYLDSHGLSDIGDDEHLDDAQAAYTHALLWYITGKKAHADKAIEIMNAWSAVLTEIKFDQPRREDTGGQIWSNGKLQAGWGASLFTRAAEIIRYTNSGWSSSDVARFEKMLTNVYLPLTSTGWTGGANWLMTMSEATIGIGVFTNNRDAFNTGIQMWRDWAPTTIYLPSDGPTPIPPPSGRYTTAAKVTSYWYNPTQYVSGLQGETLRDLGHMAMGLGALANAAETAYIQGVDLYAEQAPRIIAGFERNAGYVNAYLDETTRLGTTPSSSWTPPGWPGAAGTFKMGSGQVGWLVAYHHYTTRTGHSLPQTQRLVERLGPNATKASNHLAWEALTHA